MNKKTRLNSKRLIYLSQFIFLLLSSCSGKTFYGKGVKRPLDKPQLPPSKNRKQTLSDIDIDSIRSMSENKLNELLRKSKASEKAVFFNKALNKKDFFKDLIRSKPEVFDILYDYGLPMENLIREIFKELILRKPDFTKKICSNNHFIINKYDEVPFFLKDLKALSNDIRVLKSMVINQNCNKFILPIFKMPIYNRTKHILQDHNLDSGSIQIILGYIYPKNVSKQFGNIFNFCLNDNFLKKYNNEKVLQQLKDNKKRNQITNNLKFHFNCQTFQQKTVFYICKNLPFLCNLFEGLKNRRKIEYFVHSYLVGTLKKKDYYNTIIVLKYLSTDLKKIISTKPFYTSNQIKMEEFAIDFFKKGILNSKYKEIAIFLLHIPTPIKEKLINTKIKKNEEFLTPVEIFCQDHKYYIDTSILDTLLPKNLPIVCENLVNIAFKNSMGDLYRHLQKKIDVNEIYPLYSQVDTLVNLIETIYNPDRSSGTGLLSDIYDTEIIDCLASYIKTSDKLSLMEKIECLQDLQRGQMDVDFSDDINSLFFEFKNQIKNPTVIEISKIHDYIHKKSKVPDEFKKIYDKIISSYSHLFENKNTLKKLEDIVKFYKSSSEKLSKK